VGLVTDRKDLDPTLLPNGQQRTYLVLSEEERARGLVMPVRTTYIHEKCGVATTMGRALAETYAAKPEFYSGTFCVGCRDHFPVGADGEFVWEDGTKVGTRDLPEAPPKYVRCIVCDAKLDERELMGVDHCPKCGIEAKPVDPTNDIFIRINEQELRILAIWASNYSERLSPKLKNVFAAIVRRLEKQMPGVHLTLFSEVAAIQQRHPDTRLEGEDDEVIVPPKDEGS
jgi:hypothetical protein